MTKKSRGVFTSGEETIIQEAWVKKNPSIFLTHFVWPRMRACARRRTAYSHAESEHCVYTREHMTITPCRPKWKGTLTGHERFVRQMHYAPLNDTATTRLSVFHQFPTA